MNTLSRPKQLGLLLIGVVGLIGLLSPAPVQAETLNQLLARQTELQRQAAESKKKLEQKKREVSDLQGVISDIDDDISYTEANIANTEDQIAVTESVLGELNVNIQQTQSQLNDLQTKLNSAYVGLYELSQTSTADSLLSSASLSDIVSQAQYIQVLQTDLQVNIKKANDIKAELESKKNESEAQKSSLVGLKNNLVSSRNSLSAKRSQKDSLLAQTQGQQAQYEALLKRIQQEASQISDQIYLQRQASGGFLNQGGTGGYPWAGSCNIVDPWLYYTCQCTSYAAWKFLQIHGVPFRNTRPGEGSAYNWPALAADQGYHVSGSPQVGDAVSWNRPLFAGDQWGHVAIVEHVYSANDIVVSEYNWNRLSYSERRINPNSYGAPRYIHP